MLNIKSTILTTAIAGSFLLSSAMPVFALTTPVTPSPIRKEIKCDRVTLKLDKAVARTQKIADRWQNSHDKIVDHGQKIGARISQQFGSTSSQYTTWQADVATFTESMKTARADAVALHQAILKAQSDAKNGLCGTSEGVFKTDMQSVKDARAQVKTATQTAKTNLQALKDFVKSLKGTLASPTPTP